MYVRTYVGQWQLVLITSMTFRDLIEKEHEDCGRLNLFVRLSTIILSLRNMRALEVILFKSEILVD